MRLCLLLLLAVELRGACGGGHDGVVHTKVAHQLDKFHKYSGFSGPADAIDDYTRKGKLMYVIKKELLHEQNAQ